MTYRVLPAARKVAKPRAASPWHEGRQVRPRSVDFHTPASCRPASRRSSLPARASSEFGNSAVGCHVTPRSCDTKTHGPIPATIRPLSAKSGASHKQFTGPSAMESCSSSHVRPPSSEKNRLPFSVPANTVRSRPKSGLTASTSTTSSSSIRAVSRQARPPFTETNTPSVVAANIVSRCDQSLGAARARTLGPPRPKLLSSQLLPELRVTRIPPPSVAAKAAPSCRKLGEGSTMLTVDLNSPGTRPQSHVLPKSKEAKRSPSRAPANSAPFGAAAMVLSSGVVSPDRF